MQAELTSEFLEKPKAQADEKAAKDPTNRLRRNPGIKPTERDWLDVYGYFEGMLKRSNREDGPRAPLLRIIEDEFLEPQKLLLLPVADSPLWAKAQEENSKKYAEALKTTFSGYVSNAVLKFTMLRFGLPIEPLTCENVMHAGTANDRPGQDRETAGTGMSAQGLTCAEKPLDSLSRFNERSCGHSVTKSMYLSAF
jgi:hypothetical protein